MGRVLASFEDGLVIQGDRWAYRVPAERRTPDSARLPAAATMLLSCLNVSMARSAVGFGGMRDWTDAASGIGSVGPFTF
jgi:hypothetical protein